MNSYYPYYTNGYFPPYATQQQVLDPGEYRGGFSHQSEIFFDREGFEVRVPMPGVNPRTRVVASVYEWQNNRPHMGAASMQVHNVVPINGAVIVRGHIGWRENLPFRISLIAFN